jgi:hypothetical protein
MNEAGGSAQQRGDRQLAALDASLPASRFWRFVVKLTPEYERKHRSASAWGRGAEGERLTAKALQPLEAKGWILLNDLPLAEGSQANIDHVLIGPPGIFVIETKIYKGKGRIERNRLTINGRDKKKDLDEVWRETGAVAGLLGPDLARLGFDVRPVICIHEAVLEGRWFGEPEIAGIRLGSPRKLVSWLEKYPPRLSPDDVEALAGKLVHHLAR